MDSAVKPVLSYDFLGPANRSATGSRFRASLIDRLQEFPVFLAHLARLLEGTRTLRFEYPSWVKCQFGVHTRFSLTKVFARMMSFRMIAVSATLAGLPASTIRV